MDTWLRHHGADTIDVAEGLAVMMQLSYMPAI